MSKHAPLYGIVLDVERARSRFVNRPWLQHKHQLDALKTLSKAPHGVAEVVVIGRGQYVLSSSW